MKHETTEKLRKHTKEITDIMFLAQSSFKVVDYLYRERKGLELEIIKRSQFLLFTAETHWRIYVIEMSKLFAPRKGEHFNLHDFIKKFNKGGEFHIKEVPEFSIKIWEQNLQLPKEAALIENLLSQRDRLYGHTDRNREGVKNEFSFIDAKEFLHIVQRIVSEIYVAVFGQSIVFNPINEPVDDLRKIVSQLVESHKKIVQLDDLLNSKDYDEKCDEYNKDPDNMGKWYTE